MEPQNNNMQIVHIDPNAEPKEQSLIGQIQNDALMGIVESILPKLKPMIEPTMEKLEGYFGDDTKMFMIRRAPESKPKVIVLNNLQGNYTIDNFVLELYQPKIFVKYEGSDEIHEIDNPKSEEQYYADLKNDTLAKAKKSLEAKLALIDQRSQQRYFVFRSTKPALLDIHDSGDWVEKLLTGEFTAQK